MIHEETHLEKKRRHRSKRLVSTTSSSETVKWRIQQTAMKTMKDQWRIQDYPDGDTNPKGVKMEKIGKGRAFKICLCGFTSDNTS